jgi:hypothetical protein
VKRSDKQAKRAAVKARIAARPVAPVVEPVAPVVEPVVAPAPVVPAGPSRKEKERAARAARIEARAAAAEKPKPVEHVATEGVDVPVFVPVFLDLVPEQHPTLFPRKRSGSSAEKIVATAPFGQVSRRFDGS